MRGHPSGGSSKSGRRGGVVGGGGGGGAGGRGGGGNCMMSPIPHNPKKIEMILLLYATYTLRTIYDVRLTQVSLLFCWNERIHSTSRSACP